MNKLQKFVKTQILFDTKLNFENVEDWFSGLDLFGSMTDEVDELADEETASVFYDEHEQEITELSARDNAYKKDLYGDLYESTDLVSAEELTASEKLKLSRWAFDKTAQELESEMLSA